MESPAPDRWISDLLLGFVTLGLNTLRCYWGNCFLCTVITLTFGQRLQDKGRSPVEA